MPPNRVANFWAAFMPMTATMGDSVLGFDAMYFRCPSKARSSLRVVSLPNSSMISGSLLTGPVRTGRTCLGGFLRLVLFQGSEAARGSTITETVKDTKGTK